MRKLGVAIQGAGWVAGEHMKAYAQNPHTEVVAICSRTRGGAELKLAETGVSCRVCDTYAEMLADDQVDIVSVCTPNHLHAAEAIQAAQAGKHILLEKPISLSLEDLRALRQAVCKAGVKTVVSFVLRWNPLFETIKALLADDAVGRIFYAEVDY